MPSLFGYTENSLCSKETPIQRNLSPVSHLFSTSKDPWGFSAPTEIWTKLRRLLIMMMAK